MSSPIGFGVQTCNENASFTELAAAWRLIDRCGFDTAWLYDHFIPVFAPASQPCLESWACLPVLARETRNVLVGVLVSGNTYRHPAVLAKMATTVDHVSNGRLIFGIGAGWFESEHVSYGIPFYTPAERACRLDESLEVIRSLWTEPRATFSGTYYKVDNAWCEPKPVQKPRPSILVGGAGEQQMLRVVARHADIWNTMGSPAVFRRKIEILRRHCEAVERDFTTIEVSWTGFGFCARSADERDAQLRRFARLTGRTHEEIRQSSLIGLPDEIQSRLERFLEAGVRQFIISILAPFDEANLERFADGIAQFRR
jgi:F420-dependent oxidoreductase-like protein